MKLIVGLGNPGDIYKDSRHNIGFLAVKALSRIHKITLKREKGCFSLSGKGKIGKQTVILALPVTFMNLSGIALKGLVEKHKIDLQDLLVICDDLDLAFGRLKIKPAGSSGGHQGLNSIINTLGSWGFARLRLGIGRPKSNLEATQYVLSSFSNREKRQLKKIIERGYACCQMWATEGITKTMNIFNTRGRTL